MNKTILLLLLSTSLTSCFHAYYAPNSAHAPLLSQKGETRINAMYSAGADTEFQGGELQVAHAVGKNSGIMLNGMSVGTQERKSNYTESGKGRYLEAAYGWFAPLGKTNRQWIGEVWAGAGKGATDHVYTLTERSKVGITKFFVQPALGFRSPYFEAALVPRFGIVTLNVKNYVPGQDAVHQGDINWIRSKPTSFVFEPALQLRGGSENIKLQVGLSFSTSSFNSATYLMDNALSETLTANIGISFNLFPTKLKP